MSPLNDRKSEEPSRQPLGVSATLCVFAASAIALGGCSDGRPARVPVSGTIKIDGKPLPYGIVRFVPSEGRAAIGPIDREGRFTLTCYEPADGVAPGNYKIAIKATEPVGNRVKWHAPKKYASHKTSGLSRQIESSTDSLEIEISWDGGKPFTES